MRPTTHGVVCALLAGAALLGAAMPAGAQTTVRLWPGTAPGSETWSWHEKVFHDTPMGTVVQDVVTPTLTVYLPDGSNATGTGIIVAPGGACIALAMDAEGVEVARRLQKRGIAAFVLKYRLQHKTQEGMPAHLDEDDACRYGIADGIQAVKVVRAHAAAWGVSPHRVGFMGFSAGGMVASEVLVQPDTAARPDFAALVYGAPFGVMPPVPTKLPPVFMAWARDDSVAGYAMARFRKALTAAGDRLDARVYSAGGHGFGLKKQGTTSDRWVDDFWLWLQDRGLAGG